MIAYVSETQQSVTGEIKGRRVVPVPVRHAAPGPGHMVKYQSKWRRVVKGKDGKLYVGRDITRQVVISE
jgi:hypothetical protein